MKTSLCANSSDLAAARAAAARLGGARPTPALPAADSHGFARFSARAAAGEPPAAAPGATAPAAPAPTLNPDALPGTPRRRWATVLAHLRDSLRARAIVVMDETGLVVASAGEASGWDLGLLDSVTGRLAVALDQAERIEGRDEGPCTLALPLAGDWLSALLVDCDGARLTALVLSSVPLDALAREAVAGDLAAALSA